MLRKLTTLVARHPTVVATFAVVVVAATTAAVGDAVTAVDAPATLGTATENGTLVEPTDGGGWGGPHEVGDGDGS
jgi:hypothetical protein